MKTGAVYENVLHSKRKIANFLLGALAI